MRLSFMRISQCGFYFALLSITVLAMVPPQEAVITTGWDKANHCLAFAVLLALLDYAHPRMAFWLNKPALLLGYGLLLEIVQLFVPGRFFSWLDLFADGVGLAMYCAIRPVIRHRLDSGL